MGVTASALSAYSSLTKKLYYDKLNEVEMGMSPFFELLRKEGNWTGDETFNVPVIYGRGQGVGATFTKAQDNGTASKHKRWAVTPAKKYATATLEAYLMTFAKNPGSVVDAIKFELDSVKRELQADICRNLYTHKGMAWGKISTQASVGAVSAAKWTLSDADDVRNFSAGMKVTLNPDETGSGTVSTAYTVSSVDWDGGTITMEGTVGASAFIFREGNESNLGMTGLGSPYTSTVELGWIPNQAPSSGDSHFGVDRSVDAVKLAGWRVTDTALPLEEALIEAGSRARRLNANITHVFANPLEVGKQMKKAGSKVFRDQGGEAVMGFTGIMAALPTGLAKVYADPFCPPKRVYGLDMATWFMKYAGPGLIHFIENDGLLWRAAAAADNFEARMRSYANLVCTAPGRNFVILTA